MHSSMSANKIWKKKIKIEKKNPPLHIWVTSRYCVNPDLQEQEYVPAEETQSMEDESQSLSSSDKQRSVS